MIQFASARIVQAGAIAAAALLAASVSAPSYAAPADQPASARPAQSNASERRICAMVDLSGSRMLRRVCRTRAEWEAAGGLPTND